MLKKALLFVMSLIIISGLVGIAFAEGRFYAHEISQMNVVNSSTLHLNPAATTNGTYTTRQKVADKF